LVQQVWDSMKKLDDYRLQFDGRDYLPIMIGGMGVDISATGLALAAARLGGIGHISDAMLPTVVDQERRTTFVRDKLQKYKFNVASADKSMVKFDLDALASATRLHVDSVMEAKKGEGMVFLNCMEKLTMNNPLGTLKTRLESAMDSGIDGISLSAGLHLGTFSLIQDHPRFHDVKLGIIVSSARALNLLLKKAARTQRLPDYVIVEGPLAGGHLGFGMDWADYDLKTIAAEVVAFLAEKDLDIPVIAAGGVFTGSDAVEYMELGCAGVQCATRFTITKECGLPGPVKQEYVKAVEEDIVVNMISPTGYPMRMLAQSPAIGSGIRPNCEAYGYLLDKNGHCDYIDAYNAVVAQNPKEVKVLDKTCLCTAMRRFKVWTCGHYTYRLKDTVNLLADGTYEQPPAEHVLHDYLYSTDHRVHRQPLKAHIV
jgi:nitronate monooxygenase